MFSDADPAVALDPKQQHRKLTKLGIYSGIPVAVSRLPKTNSTLCIAPIFLENMLSPVYFVFRQKNSLKRHFSGHQSSNGLCRCISRAVEDELK